MINGIISMVINVVLNLILIDRMGIAGLALSTSIASLGAALLLIFIFYIKVKSKAYKHILDTFIKVIIASLIMGTCVYFMNDLFINLSNNILLRIIHLLVVSLIGASIYYLLIYFAKVKDIGMVKEIIRRKNK